MDLTQLHIRPMRADDPCRIAAAFADMHKTQAQYEHYWQENLAGTRLTLLAVINGEVVGYTNLIWSPDYELFRAQGIPEINDMNVVTPLRCRGIGTRMIAAAEDRARKRGVAVLGIGVGVTPDYAIAQRLYPHLGYLPDGTGVHDDPWGGVSYFTKRL